ncbi:MAG TPA: TetR/AcrR family transcriptional regulator [Kofleriaceae bacterium]|nr:TetR/AcrR family transcriptional regulator [Kofleriaceae bacterium]
MPTDATTDATPAGGPDDLRRRRLLDAALATFVRFGFRKTSMEEVARAAHLSRQGLYLHFATKEELFRATVAHALATGLDAAAARLRATAAPVPDRLVAGFDAWLGRFVGLGEDVTDLHEAIVRLVGPQVAAHEDQFIELVARVLRSSGLAAAYKPAGLTARQLADTLYATARGLKHSCATRAELIDRLTVAVRALCLPLAARG